MFFYQLIYEQMFGLIYVEVIINMLKDRGTIKWTSLMLPEHVEQLKELWKEDEKQPLPVLDEQELEQLNQQCYQAYQQQTRVELCVHEQGYQKQYIGKIARLNHQQQTVMIELDQERLTIPIARITTINHKDS